MKRPYVGDQPIRAWINAWLSDSCETLPKAPPRNALEPMKNLKIITKIVSQMLYVDLVPAFTDLKDETKRLCITQNLGYDYHVINAAIDAATRERRLI